MAYYRLQSVSMQWMFIHPNTRIRLLLQRTEPSQTMKELMTVD